MRLLTAATMTVLLVVAVSVAACSDAFEPPPDGTSGGPDATGLSFLTPSPPPLPTETPLPSPVTTALGDLPTQGEDLVAVRVLGWLETGGSVLCGSGTCLIDLVDPRDPRERVSLEVATDAAGMPNTMRTLGSGYSEADLAVTTDDHGVLWAGDHAWVTGSWSPAKKTLYADVIRRGAAPTQKVVPTTIAQLRSRKPGTLVRVTGKLDTPFMLWCGSGTCNLYLAESRSGGRSIRIEVRLGPRKGSRPNTMRPLGDNFKDSQLRVFDRQKRVCRYAARITVVGWVYRDSDGAPYVDPVQSITCAGS
jgi:hypothetical protein